MISPDFPDIDYKIVPFNKKVSLMVVKYIGDGDPVVTIEAFIKDYFKFFMDEYFEYIDMNMDNPWVRIVSIGNLYN